MFFYRMIKCPWLHFGLACSHIVRVNSTSIRKNCCGPLDIFHGRVWCARLLYGDRCENDLVCSPLSFVLETCRCLLRWIDGGWWTWPPESPIRQSCVPTNSPVRSPPTHIRMNCPVKSGPWPFLRSYEKMEFIHLFIDFTVFFNVRNFFSILLFAE